MVETATRDAAETKPPTHSHPAGTRLVDTICTTRSLPSELTTLPWQAVAGHPVVDTMILLKSLYARKVDHLRIEGIFPITISLPQLRD